MCLLFTAEDTLFSSISDLSDSYFTIKASSTPGTVSVTSPIGGETYAIGSPMTIKWNTQNYTGARVDLLLRQRGVSDSFPPDSGDQAARVLNTGTYTWNVANIGESGTYYVRVICDPYTSCNIADSNYITIAPAGSLGTQDYVRLSNVGNSRYSCDGIW